LHTLIFYATRKVTAVLSRRKNCPLVQSWNCCCSCHSPFGFEPDAMCFRLLHWIRIYFTGEVSAAADYILEPSSSGLCAIPIVLLSTTCASDCPVARRSLSCVPSGCCYLATFAESDIISAESRLSILQTFQRECNAEGQSDRTAKLPDRLAKLDGRAG
jgi:hypothetical protein